MTYPKPLQSIDPASDPGERGLALGPSAHDRVEGAIAAMRRGEPVLVSDDRERENEGDILFAAEAASTEKLAMMLRHCSGLVCVAITGDRAEALRLPPMVTDGDDAHRTAFTHSVDLAEGTTTGISALERALTVRALADPSCSETDFVRPGHVFPLRARGAGVLARPGHTEAGVDLARLAGMQPAAALCEVVSEDKSAMAGTAELERLARTERMPMISVAELVRYRMTHERLVEHVADAALPTLHGEFTVHAWRSKVDGSEHLMLVLGDLDQGEPPLVRVHSECLTGDVFGSQRCDCGDQLDDSMRLIAEQGRGAIVYLRGHEGRGIGLVHKLRAYRLQDRGHDTVDANLIQGLPVDARDYGIGAQLLRDFGVERVRLLTNSPAKVAGLGAHGVEVVERVGLPVRATSANLGYLLTKRRRLGHELACEARHG